MSRSAFGLGERLTKRDFVKISGSAETYKEESLCLV